jgi:hypothetical protein
LLNNIPKKISTTKEKHVTSDENTEPPQESNVRTTMPATKLKQTARPSKETAIVDKPIPVQMPTPRVHSKSKEDILSKQMNLRHRI